MKYQITIQVNSLDVPNSENIPQHASAVFETTSDKKEEYVGKILVGMGKAWKALQSQYEMNNFKEIILTPKDGETVFQTSLKRIPIIKLPPKEKKKFYQFILEFFHFDKLRKFK